MAPPVIRINQRWAKVTQVNDHLYMGGALALEPKLIQEYRVTCIINATTEAPSIFVPGVVVQKLWIDDTPETDLRSELFDEVADQINIQHSEGGCTMVHCVNGTSRSAALVMAYLMKYQKMSLRDAYNMLALQRAAVKPNLGFWKQLMEYETSLPGGGDQGGRSTVHFVPSPDEPGKSVPDVYIVSDDILEEEDEQDDDGDMPIGHVRKKSSGTPLEQKLQHLKFARGNIPGYANNHIMQAPPQSSSDDSKIPTSPKVDEEDHGRSHHFDLERSNSYPEPPDSPKSLPGDISSTLQSYEQMISGGFESSLISPLCSRVIAASISSDEGSLLHEDGTTSEISLDAL